jgi:hypothetical protein
MCSDGVYYCCDPASGCDGQHVCPTNAGLVSCACVGTDAALHLPTIGCVPPPPPPCPAHTHDTAGKKTVFLRHIYIKEIFLPRQARDNHRESTQKKTVLSQEIGLRDDRSHKIAIATSALFQLITTMAVPAPPVLRI